MKTNPVSVQRFEPAKGKAQRILTFTMMGILTIYLAIIIIGYRLTMAEIIMSGVWMCLGGFQIYAWFITYYRLDDEKLYYRSGFTKGAIPIQSIYKIEKVSSGAATTSAALSRHGILIFYNKFDDLFIAPRNQEKFLQALHQLNPTFEIKEDPDLKSKPA